MPNSLQPHGLRRFQAPLSMGLSQREYWSGLPFPPPRDLPSPGIKPLSPALAGRIFTAELPRKPLECELNCEFNPICYCWGFGFNMIKFSEEEGGEWIKAL